MDARWQKKRKVQLTCPVVPYPTQVEVISKFDEGIHKIYIKKKLFSDIQKRLNFEIEIYIGSFPFLKNSTIC